VVRELGLERRETVRSLSTVANKNSKSYSLLREDQEYLTNGVSVGFVKAIAE